MALHSCQTGLAAGRLSGCGHFLLTPDDAVHGLLLQTTLWPVASEPMSVPCSGLCGSCCRVGIAEVKKHPGSVAFESRPHRQCDEAEASEAGPRQCSLLRACADVLPKLEVGGPKAADLPITFLVIKQEG